MSRNTEITEKASVVTIGMICGGVRNNIVPEQVETVVTVRALHPDSEEVREAVGANKVSLMKPQTWVEDFSFVAKKVR